MFVLTVTWKVGTVALVLVDEVHTIGEERGATLEVILTRMKLVSRSPEVRLRAFVCRTVCQQQRGWDSFAVPP